MALEYQSVTLMEVMVHLIPYVFTAGGRNTCSWKPVHPPSAPSASPRPRHGEGDPLGS